MQVGGRWSVGARPPRLPGPVLEQIAAVEAELSDEDRASLRWTLTWLEGRPQVMLDGGPTILWKPELNLAYLADQC